MLATKNELDIDIQQVLRDIGYDTDSEPTARITSLVNEYVENAHQLIEPSYSCIIRDVKQVQGARVAIDGSIVFQSQIIAQLLGRCQKVAVFVLTIGNHLEEMSCRLAEDGLMLQAAVLDAIGSVAVESVANFVQDKIGAIAHAQGLSISQRFSPGYCDWDISQQKMVFGALNGKSEGIYLTDGYLMIPRKSISGIIGIGPSNDGVENYNPCQDCKRHDCSGRR